MRRAVRGRGPVGRVTSAAARFGAETWNSRDSVPCAKPGTTRRTAGNAGPTRGTPSRTTFVQRCVALFDSHHPHRAWGANGWNRANGRIARARGTRALPLPTKLNFSIFSSPPSIATRLERSRGAVQVRRGETMCHTNTVRMSRIRKRVAASGERGGSTVTRRTGEVVWARRPSAATPGYAGGHGGQLTRANPSCAPAGRPKTRSTTRDCCASSSSPSTEPEPGGGASMAAPPRRRPAQGARAAAALAAPAGGARVHARGDAGGRHPRFATRPNWCCRQWTCSTGRTCSCASPWRRWATGTSTRRASRIRSRTPPPRRAAATVGSAARC